ncbi:MAG: response regulator [Bacteroidota bacterium]
MNHIIPYLTFMIARTVTTKTINVKKRILVIEDEIFWAELLKIELHSVEPNIEIVHARNGRDAVKLVQRSQNISEGFEEGREEELLEGIDPDPEGFEEDITTTAGSKLPPKNAKYDAIITDIQMPLMDGCTAVRIIRDLLYTGPIIVWSSYRDSEEDLQRALDIPVSGFCVKEGSLQNLLMNLRNLRVIE